MSIGAEIQELALLQNADIIVHNPPSDGTLRGAADELGIPAITLEVGNPSIFQRRLIRSGIEGIHNVLCHLKMIDDEIEIVEKETVHCQSSYWLYTDRGGLVKSTSGFKRSTSKRSKNRNYTRYFRQ